LRLVYRQAELAHARCLTNIARAYPTSVQKTHDQTISLRENIKLDIAVRRRRQWRHRIEFLGGHDSLWLNRWSTSARGASEGRRPSKRPFGEVEKPGYHGRRRRAKQSLILILKLHRASTSQPWRRRKRPSCSGIWWSATRVRVEIFTCRRHDGVTSPAALEIL
jgi:hypothetical protein